MSSEATFVVGVGASAGGVEALERFFKRCPADSGGAFIVVMHLARNFRSMLDELLGRQTSMRVKPAEDGERLNADTVYVIPPASILDLADAQTLRVRPADESHGSATNIDILFNSIARHWRQRGAAIVLSGSASDGAQGAVAVMEAGGFTAAQSPETAKFESMPVAAIATSAIRAIEAPEHLGPTVVDAILLPANGIPSSPSSCLPS